MCASEDTDVVAIHDAARPLINPVVIGQCLDVAFENGASAAGVFAKDTLKKVDSENNICETLNRENVVLIQTPQCFKKDIILKAHEQAMKDGFLTTDDCAVAEHYGVKVKVIPGNSTNLKLTTPDDYYALSALITLIFTDLLKAENLYLAVWKSLMKKDCSVTLMQMFFFTQFVMHSLALPQKETSVFTSPTHLVNSKTFQALCF